MEEKKKRKKKPKKDENKKIDLVGSTIQQKRDPLTEFNEFDLIWIALGKPVEIFPQMFERNLCDFF